MQGDNLHLCQLFESWIQQSPDHRNLGSGVFNAAFHRLKLGHRIGIINQSQAEELYKDFGLLIEHLRKVAETGHKFNPQSGRAYGEAQLLINKYYFGGSQVYYNTDGYEKAFISTEYPDFIHTNDPRFTSRIRERLTITRLTASISAETMHWRTQYFRLQTAEWERLGRELENQS